MMEIESEYSRYWYNEYLAEHSEGEGGMTASLRGIDLNLLTVFDAVMREESFSRAAGTLGMTQPAVSNAVARLRHTFDDPLFVRTRYGMTPTERASELIGPVREALGILQETLDSATAFDPARSNRTFRLAMGDYGELILLPALLRLFGDCGGDMTVQVDPESDVDSLAGLKRGAVDFFFDYRPPDDAQLDACSLGDEEVVVIARQAHPLAGKRLTKKTYLAAKHVVLTQRDASRTLLESLWPQHESIPRKVMARVRQYAAMPSLVVQTDCLATLPRRMAELSAQRFPLEIYPLPFSSRRVPSYMIWHRSRARDKGHRWLKQAIQEMAAPG